MPSLIRLKIKRMFGSGKDAKNVTRKIDAIEKRNHERKMKYLDREYERVSQKAKLLKKKAEVDKLKGKGKDKKRKKKHTGPYIDESVGKMFWGDD